jgi:hypothetical protein
MIEVVDYDPGWRDGIFRGERPTWVVEKPAGFQPVTRSGAFWAAGGDRLPRPAPNRLAEPRMTLTDMIAERALQPQAELT